MAYLDYRHRDLSRRQRGAIIAKGVVSDIGYKIQEYPKMAVLAFAAAAYGTVTGASALYENAVVKEATQQLTSQKSHLAETRTLGVHRTGTIFYGVAQLNNDKQNQDISLLNSALAAHVPPGDAKAGCKIAVLNVVPDESGVLAHVFSSTVTATTFNNPAFTTEKYTCAGKTLTPTIPRPLGTFTQPAPVIRNGLV